MPCNDHADNGSEITAPERVRLFCMNHKGAERCNVHVLRPPHIQRRFVISFVTIRIQIQQLLDVIIGNHWEEEEPGREERSVREISEASPQYSRHGGQIQEQLLNPPIPAIAPITILGSVVAHCGVVCTQAKTTSAVRSLPLIAAVLQWV